MVIEDRSRNDHSDVSLVSYDWQMLYESDGSLKEYFLNPNPTAKEECCLFGNFEFDTTWNFVVVMNNYNTLRYFRREDWTLIT